MKRILVGLFMLFTLNASAVTYIFTGTGNWTDAANWNIYPAPSSGIFTIGSGDLVQVPFGSDLNINITVLNTGFFEIYGSATNSSTLNNFGTLFVFGTFSQNSNFSQQGSVKGSGIFGGNLVNEGTTQPRGPAGAIGTMDVFGDLTQGSGSMLNFEIDGTAGAGSSGGHSSLFVWGSMNYGEMLSVTLDMYMPSVGDEFKLIEHFGGTGSFSTISLPDISPLVWMVEYNTGDLTLKVDASVPHNDFELNIENNNGVAVLNWKNQNNAYDMFEVEKKIKNEWTGISGVMNADDALLTYRDHSDLGLQYYRVVGKTIDGHQSYSEVQSILISENNVFDAVFYPNPIEDWLNIETSLNSDEYIRITITNSNGTIIRSRKLQGNSKRMDLSDLAPGVYWLSIKQGQNEKSKKIIKI